MLVLERACRQLGGPALQACSDRAGSARVSQSRATSGMNSDFVRCRKQFSQEFGSDHGANPKVLTVPGAPNARRPGSRVDSSPKPFL